MTRFAVIGGTRMELRALDAIRLLASAKGYADVDLEPMVGSLKLTATTGDGIVTTVSGKDEDQLLERFAMALGA